MNAFRILSPSQQVAEHLREELLQLRWTGELPGVPALAKELSVDPKTVGLALALLEKDGLLLSQGPGRRRKITLPTEHVPSDMRIGLLDMRYDEVDDIAKARRLPSLQLVGSPEHRTLDLNALSSIGVDLVGRLVGVSTADAQFSGSLANVCQLADLKMNRLLTRIDEYVQEQGLSALVDAPQRFQETRVEAGAPLLTDLHKSGIQTILWATGYRPNHSWLQLPVFDHKGRIRHDGGVVDYPGLYLMGAPLLRRRKSSFIHGAEDDARDLTRHLNSFLGANDLHPTAEIAA